MASLLFPDGEIFYNLDGKVLAIEIEGTVYLNVFEGIEQEGWKEIAKMGAEVAPDCAYAIAMRENGGEPIKGELP